MNERNLDQLTATAILGIDTLWGGDVMNPSGTGRFIADSWFADEPLPAAYTHPTAAKVRASGGVSGKPPDVAAIDAYLAEVDVKGAIDAMSSEVEMTRRFAAVAAIMALRPDDSMILYNTACLYCAMNNVPDALNAIKKAWESGYRDAVWTRQDPDLELLHGNEEFERLYPPMRA